MPRSPSAAPRVHRPSTSSSGNTCSAVAAICAASSGGTSGSAYSDWNNAYVDALIVKRPSTFVRPDRKKIAATATRSSSSSVASGSRRARCARVVSNIARFPFMVDGARSRA